MELISNFRDSAMVSEQATGVNYTNPRTTFRPDAPYTLTQLKFHGI